MSKYYDPDPMNAPYITCPTCGGEVYQHDTMYLHANDTLCQYCLRDYVAEEIKQLTDAELVDLFEMREITPREVVAGLIGIVRSGGWEHG
jgi:hypothetical protein